MQPKVTIITITYNLIKANRKETFKQCLESVHKQTYKNIEHIIIDGASTDGTLDLIKEYANKGWITYYSEPDSGIYNAMNKGLAHATGDYIAFLNTDDFFHKKDGIEKAITTLLSENADFTYSDAIYITEKGKYFGDMICVPESFYIRMPVCHQSLFVKTSLMRELNGFDEKFKNAGDYEFIMRLFLSGAKCVETQYKFVTYRLGGLSDVCCVESANECIAAYKKNFAKYTEGDKYNYKKMWDQIIFPKKLFYSILNDVDPNLKNRMLQDWHGYEAYDKTYQQISKVTYVKKPGDELKAKLKKVFGIKTVPFNNKTKKYFLGIPILKEKYNNNNTELYLFSLFPFFKINFVNNRTKLYLFGICLCEYRKTNNTIVTYDNSIEDIVSKASEIILNRPVSQNKVAVFGIIPPEESGIADYNLNTFKVAQDKFDVFANIREINAYNKQIKNGIKNMFPLCTAKYADFIEHYKHKLYVFGNCHQHKEVFEDAIKTKGDPNRSMQLHEPWLFGMINPTYEGKFEEYQQLVIESYPQLKEEILKISDIPHIMSLLNNLGYCGLRIVINATGIKNIFVNNDKAKQMVEDELKDCSISGVKVRMSFLPIEKIEADNINIKEASNQKIIATFGIPQEAKMSETLIEAVKILNETENGNYKLVLAGYYVNSYLKTNNYKYDFIIPFDSPDTKTLFALMNSADLAVQLRKKPHGESSACIMQLLGMKQNILTSEDFVSKELEEYCHTVPRDITAEKLAKELKNILENPISYDNNAIAEKFSFTNLAKLLYDGSLDFNNSSVKEEEYANY